MDPEYERRLRDEVIYLHSLWHQGPPKPPHHPTPARLLHHPSNPTQFKKKESHKPRNKNGTKRIKNHSDSGKEWPCKPTSDSSPATTSEWKTSWPQPNSQTFLPSVEKKAKLAANQAQLKALKRVRGFFESRDDDDDEEEDDSEDDDDLMEKKEYSFFVGVFMEDGELREFYEKNYYNGEFSCLVCGGLGKKLASKKYKDCVALVQHSISIAKTKKRRAHRAYGQAICKVLGWDIARLPTIVSELSEKRELSSTNSGPCEVEDSGQAEAEANVGEARKDGLSAIENKEDSANGSNSGQCEDGGKGKGECQAQGHVGEVTRDDSNSLDIKEGSMHVHDPEFGEVEGDGKGKANVGEGNKDDLSALENNEDSANRSNSGQCEDRGKGECEAQENVGEGTKDKSTSLDSKEGSMDVDNSGQGEGEDKHNPLTGAEAPENLEDFIQAVPELMENKEAGLLNDGEHPKEESIVGEKKTDAFLDDLIRSDAPSWQENSGDSGNNNQTC
ncbi:hypothetical protein ACH5RR_028171 [Cinchona calisaya]|uniref:XS domain-containing protein n=1 Tax=Cinchona calisaya TaxID=153742 RepID=A0ABD2YRL5_9GENT